MSQPNEPKPDATQIALCRFGLGPRPDDIRLVSADPRGYLLRQLTKPKLALLSDPALPTTDIIFREQWRFDEKTRREREAPPPPIQPAQSNPVPNPTSAMASSSTMGPSPSDNAMVGEMAKAPDMAAPVKEAPKPSSNKSYQDIMYRSELEARFKRIADTDTPLIERLVAFWMNHFTVSASKTSFVTAAIGAYEREAIRPHIFGKFENMVLAVEQHPVMLIYLDNQNSIGPNSRSGNNGAKGLNENLAREILELHTLGVNGGYSQADVTAFARILTGWIYIDPNNDDLFGGRFTFAPGRHEPGDVTVLGKTYPENGKEQGEAAIRDFSRHPATAKHIAKKLAQAFVSDKPPPALVSRLEAAFLKTGGDLGIVTRMLVESPEAWSTPFDKLRSPEEFVAASIRALDLTPDPDHLSNALKVMGAPMWRASAPNGYSVDSSVWLASEGVSVRLDIALQFARSAKTKLSPNDLAEAIFGSRYTPQTRQELARAASREQALALLLMAPEFQRR